MLINGQTGTSISADDRGLMYGDGIFRTIRVAGGKLLHWHLHYQKLQHDCSALHIVCPSKQVLSSELDQLIRNETDAIAKVIITRGESTRGYAPSSNSGVTRILTIHAAPQYPDSYALSGIPVHICRLRLGQQPLLAGIKHLNRLENVLAAAEWNSADFAEGILLDQAGNLVEGTRSNLFLVKNGDLSTPELTRCGVAGVQRDRVMDWARQSGVVCHVKDLSLEDMLSSDEAFLVNSVIDLWPIREMAAYKRNSFPISLLIQNGLKHGAD